MDREFTFIYMVDTDIKDPNIRDEIKRATKVTIMEGVDILAQTFEEC